MNLQVDFYIEGLLHQKTVHCMLVWHVRACGELPVRGKVIHIIFDFVIEASVIVAECIRSSHPRNHYYGDVSYTGGGTSLATRFP